MPNKRTGSFETLADGTIRARFTFRDNLGRPRRPYVTFPAGTKGKRVRELLALMSREAEGQPWDPKRLPGTGISASPTVAEYVEQLWIPSRVGKIDSLRADRSRWKNHIKPLLGHLKIAEVTADHLRAVVEVLDDKAANNDGVDGRDFGEKTAVNCWAVVRAIFRDAVGSKRKELRILKVNPTADVVGPDGPDEIEKQWLYPAELRQLLECAAVPLWRRRLYACAVYLFCRPGEVLALLWDASIDLEHGLVRINRAWSTEKLAFNPYTKTGDTRHFAIEPVLLPVLEAMRTEAPAGAALLFPTPRHLARALREDLWAAGVRREALHVKAKGVRMMRFHDLRATGITYLALRGDSDNVVRDRAGHTDFKTTLEYIRRGQHAAGDRMTDPFTPLPAVLLGDAPTEAPTGTGSEGQSSTITAVAAGSAAGWSPRAPPTSSPRPRARRWQRGRPRARWPQPPPCSSPAPISGLSRVLGLVRPAAGWRRRRQHGDRAALPARRPPCSRR